MTYPWNDEPKAEQFVHLEPDVEEFEKENSPHERVLAAATEIAKVSKESFKKRLEDGINELPYTTATETIHPVYKLDMVNHPPHYKSDSGLESIDVIEAFNLDFCLGNTVKYILRHQHKKNPLEDLKKGRWYLDRAIKRMESRET